VPVIAVSLFLVQKLTVGIGVGNCGEVRTKASSPEKSRIFREADACAVGTVGADGGGQSRRDVSKTLLLLNAYDR
jgi:hypothetical protein